MRMNRGLLAVFFLVAASCGGVDIELDDAVKTAPQPATYLGETPPGLVAEIFAPGRISVDGRYEYALSIHPDGDRLVFTIEVPDEGASVLQSSLRDDVWTAPEVVELTGGEFRSEMEAFFSPDGRRVYFSPFNEGMDVRIWVADVTDEGVENSRLLGPPVSDDPSFFPVQAADGMLYYTNLALRAVFRATLDGDDVADAGPAGLARGGHAFPSPDGRFMLVDSASMDNREQRDIYVAFARPDGTWSEPVPLGPEVNTDVSETCPTLSPDGDYLFFSRYNEPGGLSNIYWVSADVIDAARAEGELVQ